MYTYTHRVFFGKRIKRKTFTTFPLLLHFNTKEVDVTNNGHLINKLSDWMNKNIGNHGNRFGTAPASKRDPKRFEVTKIIHLQNDEIFKKYKAFKKSLYEAKDEIIKGDATKYLRKCPPLLPLIDANVNEYYLFHGTTPSNLKCICDTGFDESKSVRGTY